jgi:DNA repair protein RecN (Recombination protein N)
MLLELHVAGLGVIDDTNLLFSEGLTALTGETGAGKTLLVDALNLVMGGKPKRSLLVDGRAAFIEARFVNDEGQEVILARELPADGRSRAWIDGRMASVAVLQEQAQGLCDIHGQHEHQSLLKSGAFRHALDAFGGISTRALSEARKLVKELESERETLGGTPEEIERERALLEYQLDEITQAGISAVDEIDTLIASVKMLEGATILKVTLSEGIDAMDDDGGTGPREVVGHLRQELSTYDSFSDLVESLQQAEIVLGDLVSQLRDAYERVDVDPERLAESNERLSTLHRLARRYGPTLSEVLEKQESFSRSLEALHQAESSRQSIETRLTAARAALSLEARNVESERHVAAPKMEKVLHEQLRQLALERALVQIVVKGAAGDEVDLLFSANPGLAPASVKDAASGGELARLMLAIRLALPGGPPTMVFDEVDAGIGGATARTLAGALHEVADRRQVLVVTHLAQVAAVADHQISVAKETARGSTSAVASEITGEFRVKEIARMLSGQPDSDSALTHARELLGIDITAPSANLV